jgi:hypothetical protein
VKKCSACTKDLPDAALHCVFCGAKQPLAPAQPPGLAKTMMGYDAAALVAQVKQQGSAAIPPPPQPPIPAPQPSQPLPSVQVSPSVQMSNAIPPTMAMPPSGELPPLPRQPSAAMPAQPRPQPPSQPPPPGQMPAVAANVPTMFIQGGGAMPQPQPSAPAPMNAYPAPHPAPHHPQGNYAPTVMANVSPQGAQTVMAPPTLPPQPPTQPPAPAGMGMQAPSTLTPPAPVPVAPPPRPRRVTGLNAAEPYKNSLRMWMFVWGVLTLVAFATPISISPLIFNWDAIIHGEGKMLLLALIPPAIGLLSVLGAFVPLPSPARGGLAVALALIGWFVPPLLTDFPPWSVVVVNLGLLALVSGLLLRNEYRAALLPRVMVTIGVLMMLVPMLIPQHDAIPLVELVKALIDGPGKLKILTLIGAAAGGGEGAAAAFGFPLWVAPGLLLVVVVVISLLAWMPPPATAGGNVLAWTLIVWPAIGLFTFVALVGDFGDAISKTPGLLMAWAPSCTIIALFGYGLATLLGKQLE